MAAPPSVTLQNLSGNYVMNKKLSDDTDALLAMQGVSWVTRKGLGIVTIKLNITEYTDSEGIIHIDIQNTVAGRSSPTTIELRQLDWVKRERDVPIFGKVRTKARWIQLANVEDPFLKGGWNTETNGSDFFVESWVESVEGGWVQGQIWGFGECGVERRYLRRVILEKNKVRKEARLVYDWLSE